MISEMTEMYNDIKAVVPMFNSISLQFILNLIPLVLLLTSVMEMYLIVLICQLIFNRLKIAFPDNFHIATMHLSRNIGIILLICLLTSFILLNVVKLNNIILEYIYLLSAIVFVLQGYSFMNYYIIVKQKKLLIIISLLLFFIPMGLFIYLILGIIDIFSDLREILLYNRNTK
jgi:uncharacterized protein YybS (DUF2232 family)